LDVSFKYTMWEGKLSPCTTFQACLISITFLSKAERGAGVVAELFCLVLLLATGTTLVLAAVFLVRFGFVVLAAAAVAFF